MWTHHVISVSLGSVKCEFGLYGDNGAADSCLVFS